jgi:carbon-monoxide dehydrogenase large subunit
MTVAKFGQALARVEDRKLLTGGACYIDDISLPQMAHAFLVYSSHAHARIKSMDISRALAAPGVLAIITS